MSTHAAIVTGGGRGIGRAIVDACTVTELGPGVVTDANEAFGPAVVAVAHSASCASSFSKAAVQPASAPPRPRAG